jgi:hypothetical protein
METQVKAGRKKDYSIAYSALFNKSVVLVVLIRGCDVPVYWYCSIVGESVAAVRVRIDPGWEMDVQKNLILAVEENAFDALSEGQIGNSC